MIGRDTIPYPYQFAAHDYDALEHFSLENRPLPDDDELFRIAPYDADIGTPGSPHSAQRRYFSNIRNADAIAHNNFGGFSGVGPKNYQRPDERLHEVVCEYLYEDTEVDATDIEVAVNAGVVELTGRVADRRQKYRATFIASCVRDVEDVVNRLRVETF